MGTVTYDQVNLMLRLYDLRREARMRQARDWFAQNYYANTVEELFALCPMGSDANAFVRMIVSYWEMCASIVNRGLIDEELYFENSGEQFFVWERIKPLVPHFRTMYKNPYYLSNLEEHCRRFEAWCEKRSPGMVAIWRQNIQQRPQAAGKDSKT